MSHPFPLVLVLAASLLPAAPSRAAEPRSLPVHPASAPEAPPAGQLLEAGPLPDDTADPDEPPILARPDAVVFPYGQRIPRITCLPYRACTLLLHPDEGVLSLALGDSERWQIEDVSAPGTRPTIVFKPEAANLLTNLVIRTDQRLYVVELLSPAPSATDPRASDGAYDALATFSYPQAWATDLEPPSRSSAPPARRDARPASEPSRLHFDYRFDRPLWPRHRLSWTPDVVYDDGERTYIHLPPEARRQDLPAVLEVTPGGEPAPLDARVTGEARDWLVVPAVSPRLRLVTRHGDATRRLTILRTP